MAITICLVFLFGLLCGIGGACVLYGILLHAGDSRMRRHVFESWYAQYPYDYIQAAHSNSKICLHCGTFKMGVGDCRCEGANP